MKRIAANTAMLMAIAVSATACVNELDTGSTEEVEQVGNYGNPNLRIAIVGAGPSGLTAAYELQARGYTNVTVFEREDHVGGKVNTIQPAPGVNVEMGAVFASPDYPLTLSLAAEYGIPTANSNTTRLIYDNGAKRTSTEFLLAHYTPAEIQAATIAYAGVLQKFPQIFDDKLSNLPTDLEENFDKFVTKYKIGPVAELAKSLIVGFGYGFYDNVPAIYELKILNMLVKVGGPTGLFSPQFFSFPTGYQSLWKAVAADCNVKLNNEVTKITRQPLKPSERIKLTAFDKVANKATTYAFDAVIISTPLQAVPKFLDVTLPEKIFFEQMISSRYIVSLIGAPGVTPGQAVFVQDNAVSSRINHVGVWANPSAAFPVFQTWQIVDRVKTLADLNVILDADMKAQGGALGTQVQIQKEWPDYFPRVSSVIMKAGFYDVVECLQGLASVYYVGGGLSFETVETAARYSKRLVDERFPITSAVIGQ
jgi:oxygen-dependent protoporphyrinogen oxidase